MNSEDYEQKKLEFKKKMLAELFKTKKALVNYENAIFDYTFDRAYALGRQDAQLLNNPKQLDAEVGTKDDTKDDTKTPTFADECESQCKSPDRLRIAAMLAAGMLANDARCYPIDRAIELADALIAKAGKGGAL